MKPTAKLLSLLLAAVMLIASLPSFAFADSTTNPALSGVTYSGSYYSSNGYSYSYLSGLSGTTLKTALHSLMTDTHDTILSYDDIRTYTAQSDADPNNSSKILLFYCGDSVSSTWDSGSTWNREHVWCQSLGTFTTSGAGADLHHLRPTDPTINSKRGNKPFGNVDGGTAVYRSATNSLAGWYSSNYWEPTDDVKGDVARIILYVYTRYPAETNLFNTDSSGSIFESLDVMLDWMELDPVDAEEMRRNNAVENIQGNRNVFIDYPELAYLMFNQTPPAGGTSPTANPTAAPTAAPTTPVTEGEKTYQLVTSQAQLQAGKNYILVGIDSDNTYLAAGYQNSNNRPGVGVTPSGDYITLAPASDSTDIASVYEFTLGGSSGAWTLYDSVNGGYLYAASSSSNYLRCQTANNANGQWTITFSGDAASIIANGTNTRNNLMFNRSANVFSCYASGQSEVYLYVETAAVTPTSQPTAQPTVQPTVTPTTPVTEGEKTYQLVTSQAQLQAGTNYILVGTNTDGTYMAAGYQNTNNRPAVSVTPSGDYITLAPASDSTDTASVYEFTLGGSSGAWTLYDSVNGGYLYAASSSSNYLRCQTANNANGQWTITFSGDAASIIANGTNTRNNLMFNRSAKLFSCYASGQSEVYLYAETTAAQPTAEPTVQPTAEPTAEPTVEPTSAPESGSYVLVTSLDDITDGYYVIVGDNGTDMLAMNNTLTSGKMGASSVTISGNYVVNPADELVWYFEETTVDDQFSIRSLASGKYVNISGTSTSGFSLTDSPSYYFNASSASAKAENAFYLATTASSGRVISIYQTDFRSYATSSYKAMYLYKLVSGEVVEPTTYTVTFKDWNGTVLSTQTVEEGAAATAPAAPSRTGYTFTGWDVDFSNVTSDLTVTAQYSVNSYTITYYVDGALYNTQTYAYGAAVTMLAAPTKVGYTFSGWDTTITTMPANNVVVNGTFTLIPVTTYTVTFMANGEVVSTQNVQAGAAATAPAAPEVAGYHFVEWDTDYSNVQSDLVVTAVYTKGLTVMTPGAQVRTSPTKGIRFATTVARDYDVNYIDITTFGTLLMPTAMLGENELTLETANVQNIESLGFSSSSTEERYVYFGSLLGLADSMLSLEITARGYVYYTFGGEQFIAYAQTTVSRSYNGLLGA